MAEDQVGMRKDVLQQLVPWTKIFSAFKVALDPKKLLLAAAGILLMQLGWWILAAVFFSINSTPPQLKDYPGNSPEEKEAAWQDFKRDRQRWNLLYEMAGTPPLKTDKNNNDVPDPYAYDIGDLASNREDYDAIRVEKEQIDSELRRLDEPVKKRIVSKEDLHIGLGKEIDTKDGKDYEIQFQITLLNTDEKARKTFIEDLGNGKYRVKDLRITGENAGTKITIGSVEAIPTNPSAWPIVAKAKAYKDSARTVEDIRNEVRDGMRNSHTTNIALELRYAKYKPYGRLRTLPWFEERGPNQYLLVTGNSVRMSDGTVRYVPWERGEFATWLVSDELPVLLEPLAKFFRPILYLFDAAGGFRNRIYLFVVILWSLATWALFGGAITRIAAVQVARANERVSMSDALRFAWVRYKSYFCAPLFPLLFLGLIVVVLVVFGFLEAWTFVVGDIVGSLLWPLVLLAGLIMAVVLVGLVGWPLMYTTISAEGSDSFDAISRSYSYVYQAPWHYLWYALVALAYGAVVIFFVGLMGSLLVYMSKWAVTLPPTKESREPAYLFRWAPTSYGWRDLLLFKSPNAKVQEEVNNRGAVVRDLVFFVPKDKAGNEREDLKPNWHNNIGTFFVTVWLYLLFLMVIGFSYSYFWSASTIIYLLMRKKVDETEIDEIHLEEEPEQPFPSPVVPSPAAEAAKPNAMPVSMVESPTLRTPAAPAPITPPAPPVVSTTPVSTPPVAAPMSPSSAPPPPSPSQEKPPGEDDKVTR